MSTASVERSSRGHGPRGVVQATTSTAERAPRYQPARSLWFVAPRISAGVKCVTGQCDWLLGSPWPHVWICASTICVRRLLVIEAEQLLRVVVQDLVGDFLRQAEALDIGKGLPVDLPILQHRIVAAGHDVIGAERFEGA